MVNPGQSSAVEGYHLWKTVLCTYVVHHFDDKPQNSSKKPSLRRQQTYSCSDGCPLSSCHPSRLLISAFPSSISSSCRSIHRSGNQQRHHGAQIYVCRASGTFFYSLVLYKCSEFYNLIITDHSIVVVEHDVSGSIIVNLYVCHKFTANHTYCERRLCRDHLQDYILHGTDSVIGWLHILAQRRACQSG